MSNNTVGVFPASGGIGGSTVKYLLPRVSPKNLVFIARNPANLDFARDAGATVRKADYDDNKALEHAFDKIDTLFLISYASIEYEHRAERHRAAIDFAIRSGVKYIFYGSLGFAGKESSKKSVAHVMQAHLDTERYLEECASKHDDFCYTIVREGLYSESYPLYTAFFDPTNPVDKIKIPHDGSEPGIAWVKREELGEGTAELIKRFIESESKFKFRGQTVLLSGVKILSLKETVDILGKIAKKQVHIHQVSEDEFAKQPQVSQNFTYKDVDLSKAWTTAFEAFRRGEAAVVSPLLGELLGREPESFEKTISQSI
ncbi:hypothetical protein BKA67DRAFT_638372 [Truncatella angustata]|uniref:NmrA-like domain-containing protein n=1 Tax=Truncatella angustata TaxID=152316 RepID=A0A9P8UFN9_9PEZI|nr:uncharacterized protein BKA67DRAFT_638372 [Truncatella angustata]KAH6649061.1 hypothetical protein BKA67DRAFT_638372 [Truncatella angustata]KAH8201807.1 hypothetical protein TruAng_004071 [Truncatella angustata]